MHIITIGISRAGATAEKLLAGLRDALKLVEYGSNRFKLVISAGDRGFALQTVQHF